MIKKILFKPMKRTSCLLLFFVTGAVFLLLSCEKEKGIEKYAGWYSGWHQKYFYQSRNNPDSLTYVDPQFPFNFHLLYDETTNCIVTEKQAHLAEYHLIVKDDGSFVSEEKQFEPRVYERNWLPKVTGRFTPLKNGKYHVEFRVWDRPNYSNTNTLCSGDQK